MKQIFSYLTFGCMVLLTLFAGTCKNDSPVKPPPPPAPPDTTSHEIEWTEYVFPGSGELEDVWAFSADFAIAVGRIQDPSFSNEQLNSYIWDGKSWKLRGIPMQYFNGDTNTINWKLYGPGFTGIWGFRRDNIWFSSFASNNAYTHMTIVGNDTMIKTEALAERGLGRIWAKDTNEIYFAGDFGGIIRYDARTFIKLFSNPSITQPFRELWGFSSKDIYTSVYPNGFCYKYDGTTWSNFRDASNPLSDSVFFGLPAAFGGTTDDDSMWVAGLWLARMKKDGTGKIRPIINIQQNGVERIRGTSKNNMFFMSRFGPIYHYNGSTLKYYPNFSSGGNEFTSISIVGKDIFIAGYKYFGGTQPLIIHGKQK